MVRPTTVVLGEAIRAAVGVAPTSDRELLRRFAAGDQSAFAALFRRHAGMVLGVCRRTLCNLQDAEDACQATFLVLARKAGSGRWQISVANWLYLTARRVARNARVAAERRARHERKAAIPGAVQPVDAMTGRELLEALDAELDRLPNPYREALVLCYLEGLTRDEASQRIGVALATLKSRLERGRKRLADALARRGCVLGAGLLALAATAPSKASAPGFAANTLAAASGRAPAGLAAPAEEASVNGVMRKALLVTLTLFGAALLGGGGLWLQPTAAEPPAKEPAPAKTAPPVPHAVETLTLSGRVVDPDGNPVAGARLVVTASYPSPEDTPVEVARSAEEGTFRCAIKPPEEGREENRTLVARAPGFAADWVAVARLNADKPVTLRLVPDDVTVRGRVVDLAGKPVAGASVAVRAIYSTTPAGLTALFARWRTAGVDDNLMQQRERAICPPAGAGVLAKVVADKDGRFEIKGIGRGRLVSLLVQCDGIESAAARVVTVPGSNPRSAVQQAALMRMAVVGSSVAPDLYGPEFTHVAKPDAVVKGVVTDAKTGKPVAGVQVSGNSENAWWENRPFTKTGADGSYRLTGLAKAPVRRLWLSPGADSPYLMAARELGDTPGLAETTADFRLDRGVKVTGRITDKVTGEPIRGATVLYSPLAGNRFFAATPDAIVFRIVATSDLTDRDGVFHFVTLPGVGVISAHGEIRGGKWLARHTRARLDPADEPRAMKGGAFPGGAFLAADGHSIPLANEAAYKIIDPPEGTDTLKVALQFDPGKTISGRVVDPEGRPAAGVRAYGLESAYTEPRTLKDGTFTAVGLDPARPRTVAFVDRTRKLAGAVRLSGDEKELPVVKLRQCAAVTGRVVGAGGKPVSGVQAGQRETGGELSSNGQFACAELEATTDAGGVFHLDVLGGETFDLYVQRDGVLLRIGKSKGPLKVPPGETKNVGDIAVQAE